MPTPKTLFCELTPDIKRNIASYLFKNDGNDVANFYRYTDNDNKTKLRIKWETNFLGEYFHADNQLFYIGGHFDKESITDVECGLQKDKNQLMLLYKTNIVLDYIDLFHRVKSRYFLHFFQINRRLCRLEEKYFLDFITEIKQKIIDNLMDYDDDELIFQRDRCLRIRDHLEGENQQRLAKYGDLEEEWADIISQQENNSYIEVESEDDTPYGYDSE
jgi:hypothetical protein